MENVEEKKTRIRRTKVQMLADMNAKSPVEEATYIINRLAGLDKTRQELLDNCSAEALELVKRFRNGL